MAAGSEEGFASLYLQGITPLLGTDGWGTSLPQPVATAYESGQGNNVQASGLPLSSSATLQRRQQRRCRTTSPRLLP